MAHSQGMHPHGTPLAFEQQDRDQAAVRQWGQTVNGLGGFMTPGQLFPDDCLCVAHLHVGPSGEMFPQLRPEMMSPMQLELLAKANGLDPMDVRAPTRFPECRADERSQTWYPSYLRP